MYYYIDYILNNLNSKTDLTRAAVSRKIRSFSDSASDIILRRSHKRSKKHLFCFDDTSAMESLSKIRNESFRFPANAAICLNFLQVYGIIRPGCQAQRFNSSTGLMGQIPLVSWETSGQHTGKKNRR